METNGFNLEHRDDYREDYCNIVQMQGSFFEFRIAFGITRLAPPDTTATADLFQTIFISPQHAKTLLAVLTQNVQQYESAFGEITAAKPMPGKPMTTLQ